MQWGRRFISPSGLKSAGCTPYSTMKVRLMDTSLIFRLVGLRYKLLWAQTRTRNGRIALFFTGYAFAILILLLMTAGGVGAAMLAVRSGQAEKIAQAVLGGLFLNALLASVVTGFGINTAFTDQALRRYALTAGERLAARHLTGILEPVWIFVLALWLGLATGLYALGAGGFWLGSLAVVLLLIADYLLARVMATLIEWLSHVKRRHGHPFLVAHECVPPAKLIDPEIGKSKRRPTSYGGHAALYAPFRRRGDDGEWERASVLSIRCYGRMDRRVAPAAGGARKTGRPPTLRGRRRNCLGRPLRAHRIHLRTRHGAPYR